MKKSQKPRKKASHSEKYRQRTLSYLEQKAQALGFNLVPHSSKSECVSRES